jgi:hypothetical protein
LSPGFLGRPSGDDHHAGTVGELRDQRRERLLQHQLDGEGIDDVDMIDRRQLRLAERAGEGSCGAPSENFAASASNASPS